MPRAVFPSGPYSILYRITAAPLTSADVGHRDPGGAALLPSAPRRPAEVYERAEVTIATRHALALPAADARIPLDVAATLLCEGRLLLERLHRRRVSHAREMLDRAAATGRVTRALSTADADYLRALTCRRWRRDRGEIDIPAAIMARVGERLDDYLSHGELLESVIRWEIAALLAERSMASWGTEAILGGYQPRIR